MALTNSQQQMMSDLGNLVTQIQDALVQAQKVQTTYMADGATNMAANAAAAVAALEAVKPALEADLAVMQDLSIAP